MSDKVNKKNRGSQKNEETQENEIQSEATMTGSVGGSYETPATFISRRGMKKLEDLKEIKMDLTLDEFYKIVKKSIIKEEVYSEKPKASSSSSMTPTSEEKNNLEGVDVTDVNSDKLQNDAQRIEAHQNGMEDIEYENISTTQQKKNLEYIKNDASMKSPNSQDTGINKKMVDDAKERAANRNNDDKYYRFFGNDVTPNANPSTEKSGGDKKLAYENTIPKLSFKKTFKDDKDVFERVNKLPAKYKINERKFIMSDGETNYQIRWEGHSSNGHAIILERRSPVKEKADYVKHMMLSEYNTRESNVESSKNNEHDIFKKMLVQSRSLHEQEEKSLEGVYNPIK